MSDNVYMRERAPRLEAALTSPVCSNFLFGTQWVQLYLLSSNAREKRQYACIPLTGDGSHRGHLLFTDTERILAVYGRPWVNRFSELFKQTS